MPSYEAWKAAKEESLIQEELDKPRFLLLDRPILVHSRRNDKGPVCDCGCGDRYAYVSERIEHIQLLVDIETGQRKLRSRVKDKATFDEIATVSHRVFSPMRCYEKQRRIILDRDSKIIFASGGSRAGKTQLAAEWMVDQWCLNGGYGASFFWVSYSLKQTRIAIQKLVEGQKTNRWNPPILPPELVASYPPNIHATDQAIVLVDGSRIELKHAGRGEGGHLQGDNAIAAVLDEWCKYSHEEVFTIMLSRLRDSGGQMLASSTPETPHWSERYLQEAHTYQDVDRAAESGAKRPVTVKEYITCFDNPWMDPRDIEEEIEAHGGPDSPIVQRQVYGKAVPNKGLLWRCFDKDRHIVEWTHRDVAMHYDYKDITARVAVELWDDAPRTTRHIAGQDFNKDPMSMAICRILVPHGCHPSDRKRWIIYVEDEILKRNVTSTSKFADFVLDRASTYRQLDPNYFARTPIVCDGTAFLRGQRGAPTYWTEDAIKMEEKGFPVRPPERHKGKPRNPGRIACIGFLNELFSEGRVLINGQRCPRLIESLQTELDAGNGDTLKRSDTKADKRSGITDALRYLAWAVLYRADEIEVSEPVQQSKALPW